ncbi:CheY-like chemotaxis protein [Nonomuraea jabiensis]|uniref:CheY-like chemotaxis protein n=1 Tax=Nonomuraea jabiensis TaxID=882448 RepID=A0A7W9L9E6_9ACTN|nr:CheY-like chemotaxis protein [Nonomuraea jabiensis]
MRATLLHRPDVLVIDLEMPGVDGLGAVAHTRSPTSPPSSIWRRAPYATISRTRCRRPRPGPGTRRRGTRANTTGCKSLLRLGLVGVSEASGFR